MNGFTPSAEDLDALPGASFEWNYQIEGLDFTNASAVMRVETIGDLEIILTNTTLGVNEFGTFTLKVSPGVTRTWLQGVYRYRVLVTFADASVEDCVEGSILVVTP